MTWPLAALFVLACPGQGPEVAQSRRPSAKSDAGSGETAIADSSTTGDGGGCGKVPSQGCCLGEQLFYCETGQLKQISCVKKPKCGWSNAGVYDCNTSGVADPTGKYAMDCTGLIPDGGHPSDAAVDGGGPCGGIAIEGCCDGDTLKYCEDGLLRVISCGLNPRCGWMAMGQYYDCGTQGGSDPSGKLPRACPGSHPPEGVPDFLPPREASVDEGVDAGDGGGGDGCTCAATGSAGGAIQLVLLLVLVAWARRRA